MFMNDLDTGLEGILNPEQNLIMKGMLVFLKPEDSTTFLVCKWRSKVCTEHYCKHSHQEKYDQNWFILSKTYTRDKAAYGSLYLNTGIGHKP
ncbi:hypothetical protein WISP_111522 [Willisornis vidua]|uniref:Uncharacterized protein n=1 Tax=Willisornis vidua TaxID=1566151 RepID=A0ABQ9D0B5_9PASS|nr:hypothetical protein WISP_111522 [Willisornis vidua]